MECPRECQLLRPVMVALVYDEHHAEIPRLLRHLEGCGRCRAEELELRGTRVRIDDAADMLLGGLLGDVPGGPEARTPLSRVWSSAVGVAAALLVLWGIFGGIAPGGKLEREDVGGPGTAVLSAEASPPLGGSELDRRLDSLDGRVRSLLQDGEDPW